MTPINTNAPEATSSNPERAPTPFAQLLEEQEEYLPPRRGEVREGHVLAINDDLILVDIGAKRDAIIPGTDLKQVQDSVLDDIQVGDEVPVYVLQAISPNDNLIVSLSKGLEQQDWIEAGRMLDTGDIFEGRVIGQNKGGLLVEYGRLRAFVPNSLISEIQRGLSREALREAKAELIGRTLSLKLIEVDQDRQRLVASERAVRTEMRARLLQELQAGEVRRGKVSGLTTFGAFVDLGGVDGLVHISELAWHHVDHPSEVVSLGEDVDVEVLHVDIERERISLSRKRLLPDPWDQVEQTYHVDQILTGMVTNVVDFGVFVKLPDGIEGLIHNSNLGSGTLSDPREIVQPREKIAVRILRIDGPARQISLALEYQPPEALAEPAPLPAAEEVTEPAEASAAEALAEAAPESAPEEAAEAVEPPDEPTDETELPKA